MTGGGIVSLVGVAVALCVVIAAVVLLAHRPTRATSPPAGRVPDPTPSCRHRRRSLWRPASSGGDRAPATSRAFPGRQRRAKTRWLLRSICGFDYEIDWVGLPQRPAALRYTHSAGLTVYFRHSRFVGYSYGPPWGTSPRRSCGTGSCSPPSTAWALTSRSPALGDCTGLRSSRTIISRVTAQPEARATAGVASQDGLRAALRHHRHPPAVGLARHANHRVDQRRRDPNTPCRTRPASHRVTLALRLSVGRGHVLTRFRDLSRPAGAGLRKRAPGRQPVTACDRL